MSKSRISVDQAEIKKMSLEELNAILDDSFEPDSSVNINSLLLALEMLEQQIGKKDSPTLDAAWETIKMSIFGTK